MAARTSAARSARIAGVHARPPLGVRSLSLAPRGEARESTRRLRGLYDVTGAAAVASGEIHAGTLDRAYQSIAARYDARYGGLRARPELSGMAMVLDFAQRHAHRAGHATPTIALESFRHMARGGIYDQLGGEFHRCTVDAIWLAVPHFEKMLYDNALLARLGDYTCGKPPATPKCGAPPNGRSIGWRGEMTDPNGGFNAVSTPTLLGAKARSTSGPPTKSTRSWGRNTRGVQGVLRRHGGRAVSRREHSLCRHA